MTLLVIHISVPCLGWWGVQASQVLDAEHGVNRLSQHWMPACLKVRQNISRTRAIIGDVQSVWTEPVETVSLMLLFSLQESSDVFLSMDANFGLVQKTSSGTSTKPWNCIVQGLGGCWQNMAMLIANIQIESVTDCKTNITVHVCSSIPGHITSWLKTFCPLYVYPWFCFELFCRIATVSRQGTKSDQKSRIKN